MKNQWNIRIHLKKVDRGYYRYKKTSIKNYLSSAWLMKTRSSLVKTLINKDKLENNQIWTHMDWHKCGMTILTPFSHSLQGKDPRYTIYRIKIKCQLAISCTKILIKAVRAQSQTGSWNRTLTSTSRAWKVNLP